MGRRKKQAVEVLAVENASAENVADAPNEEKDGSYDSNHKLRLLSILADPDNDFEDLVTKNFEQKDLHNISENKRWFQVGLKFNNKGLVLSNKSDEIPYKDFDLNAVTTRSFEFLKKKWSNFKTECNKVITAYRDTTGVGSPNILNFCQKTDKNKKVTRIGYLVYAFTHYSDMLQGVSSCLDAEDAQESGLQHAFPKQSSIDVSNQIPTKPITNCINDDDCDESNDMLCDMEASFGNCDSEFNSSSVMRRQMQSSSSFSTPGPIKVETAVKKEGSKASKLDKAARRQLRTKAVQNIEETIRTSAQDTKDIMSEMLQVQRGFLEEFKRKRKREDEDEVEEDEEKCDYVEIPHRHADGTLIQLLRVKKSEIHYIQID